MSRETIARVLKRLREQSGLTAEQVGIIVGKSGKTVNAWENNRGQPDAEILMQLCDIYKVGDILAEFRDDVNETSVSLSNHEKNIIIAYRNNPNMQESVCRLLGVEFEMSNTTIYRAASSSDNHLHTVEERPMSDIDKFRNADKVTSEEDL